MPPPPARFSAMGSARKARPCDLPPTDIEGDLRILDGDPNGSDIVDMDTYEYAP